MKEEVPIGAATGTTESIEAEGSKVPEPTEVTGSILSDGERAELKEAEEAPGALND